VNVERAAGFDLDQVYRAHGHVVLRRARQILGSEAEAEEVMQDLFTSLLSKPDRFRGESSVTTFLYAATTHRCLNRLRDRKNRARLVDLFVKPSTPQAADAKAEKRAVLRDLLSRLPEDLAEVAVYYYLDGMTHEEIASVLDCSRRHVGKLLEKFRLTAERLRGARTTTGGRE
jgi:RNA polymerase sigma-70 factor (ECF subfamily)